MLCFTKTNSLDCLVGIFLEKIFFSDVFLVFMSFFIFFLSLVLDEEKYAETHKISNNFRLKRVGWAFFLFGFLFLFLLRNRKTLLRFIRINRRMWQALSKLRLIYIFGLIKHFATTLPAGL
jgi:hypothetical protein